MTVDDWVFEAIETHSKTGITLLEVQRYIDEHHFEELAIDTLESSLENLASTGRVVLEGTRWHPVRKTSKEDALKRLFGDG
jgi:hypothetical protein